MQQSCCRGNKDCFFVTWVLFLHTRISPKKSKIFISLSQAQLQIGTFTLPSNINHVYSDAFNFSLRVKVNTHINYLSRHSFGHFWFREKQGKSLSKFLYEKHTNIVNWKLCQGCRPHAIRHTACFNLHFSSNGTIEHLFLRLTLDKSSNSGLPLYMDLSILILSLTKRKMCLLGSSLHRN